MKTLRKIGAIVLAIMMIAMVGTAWAANTPNSNYDGANGGGTGNNDLAVLNTATELTITKDIVLYNVEGSKIFEPNVTYSYSVAPATDIANTTTINGLILNDSTNTTTTKVRNGVAGGVQIKGNASGASYGNTAQVVFENGNAVVNVTPLTEGTTATVTNTDNAKVSENLYIKINPATIYNNGANPAGVYRYVITDTTQDSVLKAAGIKRMDGYNTSYQSLYLDVYLKNTYDTNGAVNGLEVYGHVLFKTTSDNKNTTIEHDSTETTETIKVTGFNTDSETETAYDTGNVLSDQYHTYNLLVTKSTVGALADVNHYFPFAIAITEAGTSSAGNTATKVTVAYENAQNVKDSTSTAIATGGAATLAAGGTPTTFTGEIKHNGWIKFIGIPAYTDTEVVYATANATETNDTFDFYKASAKVDDITDAAKISYKTDSATDATTGNTGILHNTGTATLAQNLIIDGAATASPINNAISFTNTLDAISPTGYVSRFAPYALILIGGVALLIIAMKRRKPAKDDEE